MKRILLVLAFIAAFSVTVVPNANAATCWIATHTNTQDPNLFSVTLRVTYCGDNHHFTQRNSWTRGYTESAIWSFNKWFSNVNKHGTGTSPSGRTNVDWRQRRVTAEFKQCFYDICHHSFPFGVVIRTYADGWWTWTDYIG